MRALLKVPFLFLLLLGGCYGCSATPADVLREADGVQTESGETVPLSAVVERAAAAVDLYYVYGNQAEAILMNDLTPIPVGRAILVADEKIMNVALRARPLVLEANAMVLSLGEDATNAERYNYLACNLPTLTDSIAQALPELKAALTSGGAQTKPIPATVMALGSTLISGACNE